MNQQEATLDDIYKEIVNRFENNDSVLDMDVPTEQPSIAYDTSRSVVMKQMPQYLEEMRYSDPQGSIDYLYTRKNKYKRTAYKEFERANQAEAKVKTLEQRLGKFRRKIENEKRDEKWWRNAFWFLVSGLVGLMFAAFLISFLPKKTETQGLTRPSEISDLVEDHRQTKGGKLPKASAKP